MSWHYQLIPWLVKLTNCVSYLELGSYNCDNIKNIIDSVDLCVGVDIKKPEIEFKHDKYRFFNCSTKDFFNSNKDIFDIIFIDASHKKEDVLSDFFSSYCALKENGLILLHDTYPMSERYLKDGYCSDAYKTIDYIKAVTRDFGEIVTIPVHPGISIFRKCVRQLYWKKSINMFDFISIIKKYNIKVQTIFDIGCSDGNDGKTIQYNFANSKLYLFEANIDTFSKNQENYNGENIYPYNIVISNICGVVDFHKKENYEISSIFDRGIKYPGKICQLQSTTIDEFCRINNISNIDVLKIDVEGASFEVLSGATEMLKNTKIIHIETENKEMFIGQKTDNHVSNILYQNEFLMIERNGFFIEANGIQYDSIWIKKDLC